MGEEPSIAKPSSFSLLEPARLLHQAVMSNLLGAEDDILSLNNIRNVLIRLEDTIIFCASACLVELRAVGVDVKLRCLALIERAQYAHNPKLYVKGGVPELKQEGFDGSWLEWFLKETESMHGAHDLS